MREKLIGQDLSGQDLRTWLNGSPRGLQGYYRLCDLRNTNLNGAIIDATLVRCKIDYADLRYAKIKYLHSPGTTFKETKFKESAIYRIAHKVMGWTGLVSNHQAISSIVLQFAENNVPEGSFKQRCRVYAKELASRTDLSWKQLTRLGEDDMMAMGFHAFKDAGFPELYDKALENRPELEPEDLKNARLTDRTGQI